MNEELVRRLKEMAAEDESVRAELAATSELERAYAPRMAKVHRRQAEMLAWARGAGWLR